MFSVIKDAAMDSHPAEYYIDRILRYVQILETKHKYPNGWIGEGVNIKSLKSNHYSSVVMISGTEKTKQFLRKSYEECGLDRALAADRNDCIKDINYLGNDNEEAGSAKIRAMNECRPTKLSSPISQLTLASLTAIASKQILVRHWARGGNKQRIIFGDEDFRHELWPEEYIEWNTLRMNLRDSANNRKTGEWQNLCSRNKGKQTIPNMTELLRIFLKRVFEDMGINSENYIIDNDYDDNESEMDNDKEEAPHIHDDDDLNRSFPDIENENMNEVLNNPHIKNKSKKQNKGKIVINENEPDNVDKEVIEDDINELPLRERILIKNKIRKTKKSSIKPTVKKDNEIGIDDNNEEVNNEVENIPKEALENATPLQRTSTRIRKPTNKVIENVLNEKCKSNKTNKTQTINTSISVNSDDSLDQCILNVKQKITKKKSKGT